MTPADKTYDTIIVGAGLSGLTAASLLNGYDILVLEKENRVGGRVFTIEVNGITCEAGSKFGYDKSYLPFEFKSSEYIPESGKIGLYINDKVITADTVQECLQKAGFNNCAALLQKYCTTGLGDIKTIPEDLLRLLNSFFKVIHPGEIQDYLPVRACDSLVKFETGHYDRGNGELIDELCKKIRQRLLLNAAVSKVKETGECVQVSCMIEGNETIFKTRTAIVATPPPAAQKIVDSSCRSYLDFINSLRGGMGTVLNIIFKSDVFIDFSYIVSPDLPFNTIIKSKNMDNSITIAVYFVAGQANNLAGKSGKSIFEYAIKHIKKMGIGSFNDSDIVGHASYCWDYIGPIISKESYGNWNDEFIHPSDNVALAGDYTYFNSDEKMPYGMASAVSSGIRSSELISRALKKRHSGNEQ